jgi:ribosomal protein S27E
MARQFSCPSCGAPLNIESAFTTYLVCNYCGASLYLSDGGIDITGKTAKLAEYPSRFAIGVNGSVKGRAFHILGHIRYTNEDGYWDEWFLQFNDQQVGWIVEDEGDLTLTFKSKLTFPVMPYDSMSIGTYIPFGNDRLFLSEKGEAHVDGVEGEMAINAPPGKTIHYVDGNMASKAIRLILDEHAIMLYTGEPLEFNDVSIAGGSK